MDLTPYTKKVGPFPIYVWGLVFGGVIVVYIYVKAQNSAASPSAASTVPSGVTGTLPNQTPMSVGGSPVAASSGSSTAGAPVTNAGWIAQAMANAGTFGVSPLAVEQALSNYTNGMPLNPTDQATTNAVLNSLGAPPEGIIGLLNNGQNLTPTPTTTTGSVTTTPKPKPVTKSKPKPTPKPTPKPSYYTYRIVRGDNLTNIAKTHGTSISEILKLNPYVTNPNLIYAGKTLKLPTKG